MEISYFLKIPIFFKISHATPEYVFKKLITMFVAVSTAPDSVMIISITDKN